MFSPYISGVYADAGTGPRDECLPKESAMRMTMLALLSALAIALPGMLVAETVPIPATAPVSEGVELVMVDRAGCIYCAAWKAEVMPEYSATAEGRAAPLRIVDIDGPWPDGMALASRPFISPTFILLRGGIEEARLEGYPGEQFFWPLLKGMLKDAAVPLGQGS